MTHREVKLVSDGGVMVDGVTLSRSDLIYLLGFVNGAAAAQMAAPPVSELVECPLTDEEYDLIGEDEDDEDDDEPEFPTAYEGGNP